MTAPLTSLIYHTRHAPMYIPVLYRVTNVRNFQGCLPSWFREEHKDPPQALETSNSITNEIDDPPELLQPVPQGVSIEGTKRRHHHESNNIQEDEAVPCQFVARLTTLRWLIYAEEFSDASESEELDLLYGTAAPVRINHNFDVISCSGWCYRGGNCTVDVDEVTYELRSVNCHYSHIAGNTRCSVTDLTPSLSTAFGRLSLIGSRIQHQLVEMPKIAVRNTSSSGQINEATSIANNTYNEKNGDKKEEEEGSAYDEFVPAAAVASQYYMDQIHLEKPTKSEIQDALKKQDDGDEPLRPPGPCPSEYQLEALNQQLKALPMVVAFNEMEKKKATN
ncbi:unnamed protein product [Nippostrongylus brasiliensis]|uniref:DUF4773 domain-containing protein n=1 Tax=Nippostrongylus brasiliensis TaxID=27835 RepID=A0A158QZQ7_NIPBR|nr:unnamed protein product [Nippostrongylus brasiliensis]